MDICFLDFETFWSPTHSLSKMNPIEYVMHPETEIQSLAIKWNTYTTEVFFGEKRVREVMELHRKHFASDTMIVAHNGSGFDHLITAWRYGIKPKAWGCTLAMSRPFYGVSVGGSLKKVAAALNLGEKGDLEAINTKGLKFKDFTPEQIEKMRVYNKQDVELCAGIFYKLAPLLSKHELKLIDLCTRMTVEPKFVADTDLLQKTLNEVRASKRMRLVELAGIMGESWVGKTEDEIVEFVRSVVMSQAKFSELLTKLDAPVPLKPSPTGNGFIPALAKTDKGMEQLLESDDERVSLAASIRLENKSTQLETRLQTYLNVSQALDGAVPMPINYCGAAISWRMSGAMKMNVQNNPRIARDKQGSIIPKPSNALRLSLCAPPGMKVVVVDSSNIELRVAHKLAGQQDVIEKLRNKEDLYCWFASMLFGRTVTKKDEQERFIGKVAMLSLQYGASWTSFQNMVRVLSGGKVRLDEAECRRVVALWRKLFPYISGNGKGGAPLGIWHQCKKAIEAMYNSETMMLTELNLFTAFERLVTPAGHWLQYPELRRVTSSVTGYTEYLYGSGANKSRIHGAHLFENICQHIARLIVMEQTAKLDKMYPDAMALSCHDEAVLVVGEEVAVQCKADAIDVFSRSPSWWPDLPLAAEAGIGERYGEAK